MFRVVFSDGAAPKVIEGLKDAAVEAKKDVTLKCKIDPGKPQATAEWYECIYSYFCSALIASRVTCCSHSVRLSVTVAICVPTPPLRQLQYNLIIESSNKRGCQK